MDATLSQAATVYIDDRDQVAKKAFDFKILVSPSSSPARGTRASKRDLPLRPLQAPGAKKGTMEAAGHASVDFAQFVPEENRGTFPCITTVSKWLPTLQLTCLLAQDRA